jgi:hypothetical protein
VSPVFCLARGARFLPSEAADLLADVRRFAMQKFSYGPAGLAFVLSEALGAGAPDVEVRNLLHACVRMSRAARVHCVGIEEEPLLYALLARVAFGALRSRWHLRTRHLTSEPRLPSPDDVAPAF